MFSDFQGMPQDISVSCGFSLFDLTAEGEGFEEDRDEYMAENIFFVPSVARWSNIKEHAHTPEIGKVIDAAMDSIEQENKKLKGVLPKTFARPELDKRRLGEVVDLFTNIAVAANGGTMDLLGRAYEYCLSKFAEQEGKLAGEFHPPACVVRTLVEVIQPFNDRVYEIITSSLIQFNDYLFQRSRGVQNPSGGVHFQERGVQAA